MSLQQCVSKNKLKWVWPASANQIRECRVTYSAPKMTGHIFPKRTPPLNCITVLSTDNNNKKKSPL